MEVSKEEVLVEVEANHKNNTTKELVQSCVIQKRQLDDINFFRILVQSLRTNSGSDLHQNGT